MRTAHISEVDLNLLAPMVALLEEQHVSRAARRVGLSQPAMSRALSRLREVIGDELLVRIAGGYRLTPRGEALLTELADIVPGLEAVFGGERFDPARAEVVFDLVGTDYSVQVVGHRLFGEVLRRAPRAIVRFHGWHEGSFDEVRRGEVDLLFFGSRAPGDLRSELILTDRFVCVVDSGHPLARSGTAVSLADYAAAAHLVIDVTGTGQPAIEQPLRGLGIERRAPLSIPEHAAAPRALLGTQLVATLPERLARDHIDPTRHAILAAPAEIEPMDYRLCWHPALERDAANVWLRGVVKRCVADMT